MDKTELLRYRSTGEVHKDFHGLTCATMHYLIDNYGEEALAEVLTSTAQKVYKTIHEGLKQGILNVNRVNFPLKKPMTRSVSP